MISFGVLAALLAAQFIYFLTTIQTESITPAGDFDLVLTYSDLASLDPALELAFSREKPLFVSQAPWELPPFPNQPPGKLKSVYVDTFSRTTDANARQAARFIKRGGYKKVVLDVAWFHLPRALFLTRLYLLGSGVEVIPCAKTLPPGLSTIGPGTPNASASAGGLSTGAAIWWKSRLFHVELFKFWGSLGRVALAAVGLETGPNGPPKNQF